MIEITEPLESYAVFPGPILLLAGPGTGKTYQLAKRVKYLVTERKASPEEITVITFTSAAARNMRERLLKADIDLSSEDTPDIIRTMHSVGNMIIGLDTTRFSLPSEYEVLTQPEQREVLIKDAATIAGFPRSKYKDTNECRRMGSCEKQEDSDKCRICEVYQSLLRKCGLVDYDDQIYLACEALRNSPEIAEQFKKKTRYLLVDEYQDINQAQCELIQLLSAGQTDGLFVVGDDDQSIYAFRGGSPKYMRAFETYYGNEAKIGRLSISWRCPEHILLGAKSVIQKYYSNSADKPQLSFSEKIKTNNKAVFFDVPSEGAEAQIIASIAEDRRTHHIIVIIPNSNYFPPIKEAFTKRGINYNYKTKLDSQGVVRFAVLADWIEYSENSVLLRYLSDLIIQNNDALVKTLHTEENSLKVKRDEASRLMAFLWAEVNSGHTLYEALKARATDSEKNPFIAEIKALLDTVTELLAEKGGSRHGLLEFMKQSASLVGPGGSPNRLINEVRAWRAEKEGSGRGGPYLPVEIYNMPSSKGLEADIICVLGMSEGLFPAPEDDMEEKARLFYVAMTRAKKELFLFSARRRSGSVTFAKKSYQLKRSPFIDEIPKDHIEYRSIYPRKRSKAART